MKKILIIIVSLLLATAATVGTVVILNNNKPDICEHVDLNDDEKCDKCGGDFEDGDDLPGESDTCEHRDADDNGKCDKCGEDFEDGVDLPGESDPCEHRDADDNGKCDKCGEDFEDGVDLPGESDPCEHRDADDNGKCDKCGEDFEDGVDLPGEPDPCEHRDADDNGKCDKCGEDFEDGVDLPDEPGHTHIFNVENTDSKYFAKEADCTNAAKYYYSCSCGEAGTRTFGVGDPLGHTEVTDKAVEATCTMPGFTEGRHCTRCGATTVAQVPVAPKGHKAEEGSYTPPTCTEPGHSDGTFCTVCGAELHKNENIPALGHDEVAHEAKAPTCTEIGWDAYVTCTRCDHTTYVKKAALGHTEVIDKGFAASCIAPGLTDGKHCSVCNETIEKQYTVSALGHSFVGKVCERCGMSSAPILNVVELYNSYTSSSVNLDEFSRYFTSYDELVSFCNTVDMELQGIEKYDRNYFKKNDLVFAYFRLGDPGYNFTATGESGICTYAVKIVSVDSGGVSAMVVTDFAVGVEIPKDYLKTMEKLEVYIDDELIGEFELSNICDHSLVYTSITEPGCVLDGEEKRICLDCGEVVGITKLPASGHEFGPWKKIEKNGCSSAEYSMRVCTKCFALDYDTDMSGILHPHDFEVTEDAASCTESGRVQVICKNCGIVGADEIIAPLGHNLNLKLTASTHSMICVRPGCDYKTDEEAHRVTEPDSPCEDARCSVCGYITRKGLGHDFGTEYTVSETHHWYECKRVGCGAVDIDSYGAHRATGAKCTDSVAVCDVCKAEFVPSTQHCLGTPVISEKASCTQYGRVRRDCIWCDYYIESLLPPTNHNFTSWQTVKAPTETESGSERRDCTWCDYYELRDVAPTGHTFGAWRVTVNPTCTEVGEKERTCTGCGYVDARVLFALGHSANVWYHTEAPTCTESGSSYGYCYRCGEYMTRTDAPLGHNLSDYMHNEDSHWRVCVRCGIKTDMDQHSGGTVSCTQRARCEVCKAYYGAAPTGHNISKEYHSNALEHYMPCLNGCGAKYYAEFHTYKVINERFTEIDDGAQIKYVMTFEVVCTVCEYRDSYSKTVASEHYGVEILMPKSPTCTESGLTLGYKCAVAGCGEIYLAQETLPALGHSFNGGVCIRCGAIEGYGGQDPIPAPETHECTQLISLVIKEGDCSTPGIVKNVCSTCGKVFSTDEIIHPHDTVAHEGKAPTCTEGGWDTYETCKNCDYTTYAEKSALGHDEVTHEAKAPTCTEIGFDAYVTCTRCDYTTYAEKAALGHDEVTHEAKAPTCTEIGWDACITCTRCDYSTYVEKKDALGHNEVAHEAKAPTCTEIGWDAYVTCTRCDYTTYVEKAALGHGEVSHEAKAPTCTEIGWDAYVTCTRCDYTTYAEKSALGHDEVTHEAKAPTCTEIGWDAYVTCTRCDYTTYAEKAALGHDEVSHEAKAPTCTEIGWDAYVTCTRCDYTTYVEKAALDHKYSSEFSYDDNSHYHICTRSNCFAKDNVENHTPDDSEICSVCGHQGEIPETDPSMFTWTKVADGYEVTKYTGSLSRVAIPSVYQGEPVVSIGSSAFYNCRGLASITIPDSVESIGDSAFRGCSSLKNITLPFVGGSKTATSASSSTLFGYIFGESSYTGGAATKQYYYSSSYKTYYIPSSLKSVTITGGNILYGAFYNCTGLTSVVIGNGVESIGKSAFYGCTGLTGVHISDIASWCNISFGNSYANPLYYAKNLYLNRELVTDLVIPDSVTSIGYSAFYKCTGLTSVVIGNGVTSIGGDAFYYCTGLTSVVIGNGVTRIGSDAFLGCTNLTSITIPFAGSSKNATGYESHFGYIFGYSYSISSSSSFLYHYYDSSTRYYYRYDIPTSLKNVTIEGKVKRISNSTFSGCTSLTSITIPDSVTSIGSSAFYCCTSLTSITIPDSVTSIGGDAFYGCTGLTSITIPDSVTSIGSSAFSGCTGLTSITIPDSVTSIGSSAFSGCTGLTSVVIGNSVTSIGDYAFRDCTGLTSITIPDSVTSIGSSAFSGCTGLTSVVIGNSVTSIGDYAFRDCTGLTSITIGNGVESIGDRAFDSCTGLMSITIPDSVTSIGYSAFWCCSSLESITLPFVGGSKTATSASSSTLFGYIFGASGYTGGIATEQYFSSSYSDRVTYYIPSSLKSVTITGGNILYGAFNSCGGLTSVVIGNGVKSIGSSAFEGCTGLTSVTIPDSVTSIGSYAFSGCTGLTSITIPDSVTSIGAWAFYNCTGLTSVVIGNGVKSIGYRAFMDCTGLTSVVIGNGVKSIGDEAFYGCRGLTSITMPDSVTSIGKWAFSWCTGLTSITIPDSVTSIGTGAFYNCAGLTSIKADANNQYYKDIDGNLYSKDGKKLIQYAIGKTDISFVIPDSVEIISSYVFSHCTGLTSITIPDSVTSIGDDAFDGCTSLTSIIIPFVGESNDATGYKSHFGYIFGYSCSSSSSFSSSYHYYDSSTGCYYKYSIPTSLKKVTVDGEVTSIGDFAFRGCTGLTSITIPDSVTSIGSSAFSGCTGLASITIPDSVTSIGDDAFSGCKGLTSVVIGNGVTSIGDDAFSGCKGLIYNEYDNAYYLGNSSNPYVILVKAIDTSITSCKIHDNTRFIHSYAFYKCTGITSITIPDSVTSIGSSAFSGCTGLTSITVPDSVTSIGSSAFRGCTSLENITLPFVGGSKTATSASASTLFGYIFGESSYTGGIATEQCYYSSSFSSSYRTYYIPSSLKSVTITGGNILYGAFNSCGGLTSVVIGNGVKSIGSSAFEDCTGLTSVTIPDSVTSIGYYAFTHCLGLKSITIPDSVTSIGGYAFSWCKGLTSITIPDSVTSIGDDAFYYCSSLTSVTIPDSVTSIGSRAFLYCTGLKSIKYRGTSTQWKAISKGYEWDYNTGEYTITYNYTGE